MSKQEILIRIEELLFGTELDSELLKEMVQDYDPETATQEDSEDFLGEVSEILSQENIEEYNLDEAEIEDLFMEIKDLIPERHIVAITHGISSESEEDDEFAEFIRSREGIEDEEDEEEDGGENVFRISPSSQPSRLEDLVNEYEEYPEMIPVLGKLIQARLKESDKKYILDTIGKLLNDHPDKTDDIIDHFTMLNANEYRSRASFDNSVEELLEEIESSPEPSGSNVLQFKRKSAIINDLVKLADKLDSNSFHDEADLVDQIIKEISN